MKILGLDPSLTNFGYALHDTDGTGSDRCLDRGRFQTPAKMAYVDRYITQRERLRELLQRTKPDAVGIEYPVFDNLYSEGMYGLFLYSSEALRLERKDVVFFSPGQIKAQARLVISRPPKWPMGKQDMMEATKVHTASKGLWNHNECDAYWVAVVSGRFWLFQRGLLAEDALTPLERQQFLKEHTYTRGKRAGSTVQSGIAYREDERFFLWSETPNGAA